MLLTTVCAALSAAGLAVAFLTAYRRRFVAATRIAAYALLPVGLAMSGLAKLGTRIGRAVGDWATDLVFKPTVWTGFAVLSVAVLLYVIARFAEGRAGGRERESTPAGGSAPARGGAPELESGSAASRPKGGSRAGRSGRGGGGGQGGAGGEDFSEIEAILKKHGI